jgi:outer membrane protein assembly factor BamB
LRQRTWVVIGVVALVVATGAISYVAFERPTVEPTVPHGTAQPCGPAPASASPSGSSTNLTGGNWTTYHGNNSRAGVASTAPVRSVQVRWSGPTLLDGQVYAEPLLCGGSVFVATENNSVYAINASTGTVLWRTNLGTPVVGASLPCGDIDPSGITGTPVIDEATGILYVVAYLQPFQHYLYGLLLRNGTVATRVAVNPPGVEPQVEQQRGALALSDGTVYIPYGGLDGDCGSYHGWVVGVPTEGSSSLLSYGVPTGREGGIWASAGISVAANGNLYVATGNSASTTTFDYGDSVLELSPSLQVLGYFAPTNWAELNSGDVDLGSAAPTVLPNGTIFQIGKEGIGYLLSGSDLGGIGGQLYNASVCGGGAYGGTAQVAGSVLVPCTDGVYDLRMGSSSFSLNWQTTGFEAGPPIVTGNLVWSVDTSGAKLLGFNLSTGHQVYSFPLGSADRFVTPVAAPGSLFVAGGDQLFGYTLT